MHWEYPAKLFAPSVAKLLLNTAQAPEGIGKQTEVKTAEAT